MTLCFLSTPATSAPTATIGPAATRLQRHCPPSCHKWYHHWDGPSWSVRLLAAPRSVGPAVFQGSPPTHTNSWSLLECAAPGRSSQCGTCGFPGLTANPHQLLVPPGVCGSWPLLAVWNLRFSRAHRQPTPTCSYQNAKAVWTNRRKCMSECASQPHTQGAHEHMWRVVNRLAKRPLQVHQHRLPPELVTPFISVLPENTLLLFFRASKEEV